MSKLEKNVPFLSPLVLNTVAVLRTELFFFLRKFVYYHLAALEGLIAQGNREQQKIKAEIEQIKERLQAKATRDPHQEAVVAK